MVRGEKVALVVDASLIDLPAVAPILYDGFQVVAVAPLEPSTDSVEGAVRRAREIGATAVVAVGGGSALDTGKIAAAMTCADGAVTDHLMCARPLDRRVRLVAVPTTAGSGAEVTRTCVLSHEGRKTWMWDEALVPDVVVLDPLLTLGLPEPATVATGLDAFVHAVEAYTNRYQDPLGDEAALAALADIPSALPRVVEAPDDVDARRRMLEAATTAGIAINLNNTALAHCVGHALAALSPVPHGLAVALGLRATLEWCLETGAAAYREVAQAIAPGSTPADLPALVDELYERVGFCAHLARFATAPLDVERLAAEMAAPENRPMATSNVRRPETEELADVAAMVAEWWSGPG